MTTKDPEMKNLLAGFHDFDSTIEKVETHHNCLELFVSWKEPGPGQRICPECGSTCCNVKDGGTTQTIRHTPLNPGYSSWLFKEFW